MWQINCPSFCDPDAKPPDDRHWRRSCTHVKADFSLKQISACLWNVRFVRKSNRTNPKKYSEKTVLWFSGTTTRVKGWHLGTTAFESLHSKITLPRNEEKTESITWIKTFHVTISKQLDLFLKKTSFQHHCLHTYCSSVEGVNFVNMAKERTNHQFLE